MTTDVYQDLNGNNKKDEKDQFGFTSDRVQFQPTFFTSGLRAVETADDGRLVLSPLLDGERSADVISKIAGYMSTSRDAIVISQTDDNTTFTEGRAMFHAFPLAIISSEALRNANFTCGFVPWPAYEAGDDSVVVHSNALTLWSIPVDAPDANRSAAVMEAMASEGHRTIAPALFETAYKVKYNMDESSLQSQIFDEMRANIIVDLGRLLAGSVPIPLAVFADTVAGFSNTWVSKVAAQKTAAMKKLDELYEICAGDGK